MGRPEYISNSQIGTMLHCPRQWEFRYIKGLKIRPSGALVQGSSYHEALKANFENKIKTGDDLLANDLLDAFSTSWDNNTKAVKDDEDFNDIIEEKVNWEDKDPGELKDETINALKVYHSKIAPMIRPLAVEQRRDVNIGDIHFMGFIDLELLGETADHKLKSRSMSQDDANKELQPYSYALLNGKREFTFHVAVKKKVPEIQLVHVSKTINDIEWFKNLIINIDKQINSGIFPPNPCGWWCGEKWCGYFSLCHSIGV